jgi:hypothetical protein
MERKKVNILLASNLGSIDPWKKIIVSKTRATIPLKKGKHECAPTTIFSYFYYGSKPAFTP